MTTKGMSPSRFWAQNSPRKPRPQDGSSIENSYDLGLSSASLIPCRAPLCPIPLPSQLTEGIGNGDTTSKVNPQVSTPQGKSKIQQRSDNTGGTPDKHTASGASVQSRNRFGWHQPRSQAVNGMDREYSSCLPSPTGKYGQGSPRSSDIKGFQTPSKLMRSSSFSEASHSIDGVGASEGQLNSTCVQTLNKAGSLYQSSPRSTRSLKSNDQSIAGGSQLNKTPNCNVSRSLKYSTNNVPSSTGASGTRLGFPGLAPRGTVSQQTRAAQPHSSDHQSVELPYFELEEDPSFWNDHNVQVLIRCRPLSGSEIASYGYSRCLKQETAHTVTWIGQPESRFTFDHVACEKITQEKLFKIAGIPMVDNCMSGYNSCMFAYGQTGSGKTHTMLGDIGNLEQRCNDNRGMTPRIFEYLFGQISMEEEMRKNEQLKFTCKCSFLEIYNEQITDLLEPSSTNLQMREDIKKGVYVENLSEVEVKSVQDVVILLLQGAANRRVAATNMNQESSRSHSVFTCIIESKWESESMTNLRFGRLNLVDLAGSERQKSSGAEGERLKEAANINKSLSTLGLVIMILVDVAQGKQRHVPYRDSKLTFLLQDSLGGNSKTTIIANVSPSLSCAAETLSTLKFAQRAKFIRNNAIVNEDASGDVLALRMQIQQLKEELNRLSRQSISRIPLSSGLIPLESSKKEAPNYSSEGASCLSRSIEKGESSEAGLEKVKALEAVVVGSLRREKAADNTAKRLKGEIEQLNCLVRQREDDAQFNRMMLRFREDKIRRLESTIDGALSEECFKSEETQALKEELDLMRGRLDKNPELTRFAMENIRLREQFQRLQDFYEGGDRELLLEEIAGLRDQLSEYLEAKLAGDENTFYQMSEKILALKVPSENCFASKSCEEGNTVSKLESALEEKDARIEWEVYRADELNRQLDDARHSIEALERELKDSKEAADTLANRLQFAEAGLAAAQETAASAQATVKQIRLETEDIALQQRLSFSEIQEATTAWRLQELQLRSQLDDAQNMIKELSMNQEPVSQSPENESNPGSAQTIMQLQVELEALDCLIQEERRYRKEGEEKLVSLNTQFEESKEREMDLRAQMNESEARMEILITKFEEAEEKELEMSKRLLESVEDLNHHKQLVESMEAQALLTISEINSLHTNNNSLTEALRNKEDELKLLTGCVVFLQSELQRELELHVLEMEASAVNHDANLKEKLERTRKALEQAEQLNSKLQIEQSSLKALEHERELVCADVERETTEAITVLQSELISLCEDHKITQERGSQAEQRVAQLKADVVELQTMLKVLTEENAHLNQLYQNSLKEKDSEISKLGLEWEMASANLIVCLSEGNQALDAAAQEMDGISECSIQGNADMGVESCFSCKENNFVEVLEKRLSHAQKLAKETEDKVRIFRDASLTIADMQRQESINMQNDLDVLKELLIEKSNHVSHEHSNIENLKARALKGEKMFVAACLVINKLSEKGSELYSIKQRMQHVIDNFTSNMKEKDTEIHQLQLQRGTNEALLKEREVIILNNEKLIENLSKEMQNLVCQKMVMEDNYASLKYEQQMATMKCEMVEETCAMLLGELHLANDSMNENIVRVVEIQVLKDLLSYQENLVEDELLQRQSMFCEVEAQYQAHLNVLMDKVCLLEARNEALLMDLTNERNLCVQLREDMQDNTHKLSIDFNILEKKLLAQQKEMRQQHQDSCSKVHSLESQNASLLDKLNWRNVYASEIEERLQKLQLESSVRLLAVMESWSKDKIAAIIEAECLKHQVHLMAEDQLLSVTQLDSKERDYYDQITHLKKENMGLMQRITETDVAVQELKYMLEGSTSELHMYKLQVAQAEKNGAYLSIHLESLSEELAAADFIKDMQMEVIKCVLHNQVQLLEDRWLMLMLEMVEARNMSAEFARQNSHLTAKTEGYIAEIASLKLQNIEIEDVMGSLTQKLLLNEEQLQLLRAYTKQAEVRCDHLVSHSSCIEERCSLEILNLVLEEAILKEMLVCQEDILKNEASVFQACMQLKLDSLMSENVSLESQVDAAVQVAEHCMTESKSLIIELKTYREQIFQTEVKQTETDGMIVYKLQTGHDGEPKTIQLQGMEGKHSNEQQQDLTCKDLLDLKENLRLCRCEVDILTKERNKFLSNMKWDEHFGAGLDIELKNSCCEFKQIQLAFLEMDQCFLHTIGLSKTYANLLTKASSIATHLKEENGLLLKELHEKENEINLTQIKMQQTLERFLTLENMHQILEQENKKSKEELRCKEISHCHLQTQLTHSAELLETCEQMYKDVSEQLHSRNLEIEQLYHQQQDSLQLISSLHQEKELLQEELTTKTSKLMSIDMLYQYTPVDYSQSIGSFQLEEALESPKDLPCYVDKLKLSNQELKAEVERQRGDMKCLQHELQKSCDIVSEVKHAHSKTLEMLQEREQQAEKLRAEVETICASTWVLEKEVQVCKEQVDIAWKKVDSVMDEKKKLEEDLMERDHKVKNLEVEIALLHDRIELAKQGLNDKQLDAEKIEDEVSDLQQSSTIDSTRLALVERDNVQLRSQVQELIARKEINESDLEDKQHAIQMLEMQLLNLNSLIEQEQAFSLNQINLDERNKALKERDLATKERDELHAELVVCNEELEMAQQLAEEHEAIAVEARQIAEASKTRAEKKEEEAKLLERSIEELESTVNALETQVGLVKIDAERQRLMREDTEMELQALRHQMSIMQAQQVETGCDWEQAQRDLEKKILTAEGKVLMLERQCDEKDEQIRKYQKEIMDIMSKAEKQASDHHQIIKTLENLAEQKPVLQLSSSSKLADRSAGKPRGSGSPFKCIGSGLSYQLSFEIDEELNCNRQKIEELEALANSRQKEIFMLNVRLAEAESMTHDVIRDLVGVKLDITNYATVTNHQQVQDTIDKSFLLIDQASEKDKEFAQLKTQLNHFIEERESWLEEINRRQAEMMTARVAAEKLRQRDQFLSTENENLKMENVSHRNRVFELEEEVKKLSGQQNLQQRIHHHAKIKDENNQLRMKNEDLATKLRRSESLLNRVAEELARYREAEGRTPFIDVEEEQRLEVKLREVEEEKIQIAQELLSLCTSVLQVAGLTSSKVVDHTVAAEALNHLQNRLDTAEREVSDMKLKNKIESEKRRLSELRSLHSPVTASSGAAQECSSPY